MENESLLEIRKTLQKQKYHFVGLNAAIKRCKWLYESLINNRTCYKQKFFGIKTHQCIQMSPNLYSCTQECLFCWRVQNSDLNLKGLETKNSIEDPPKTLVENCMKTQRKILTGYKGNPKTNKHKLMEAFKPKHVAISLTGEPTLYSPLGDLIKEFNNRQCTTFLVSNGTCPETLKKLSKEPTQLYISLCAPTEDVYKQVCRPQIPNAWKELQETLALLPSFNCPTVIRITAVSGLNMNNSKEYAKLIEKANPTYIEPKAYMHVGFSRLRLTYESMPSLEEMVKFSNKLAETTGYRIIDKSEESRVILLSRLDKAIRFDG